MLNKFKLSILLMYLICLRNDVIRTVILFFHIVTSICDRSSKPRTYIYTHERGNVPINYTIDTDTIGYLIERRSFHHYLLSSYLVQT